MNAFYQFSPRDYALATLAAAVLTFSLFHSPVRSSLREVVRAFLRWKIWVPAVVYVIYLAIGIHVAMRYTGWTAALTKDSLIWALFSGIPLLFGTVDIAKSPRFFAHLVQQFFRFGAISALFLNYSSLSYGWEIILQFSIAFIVLISVVAGERPEYRSVKVVLNVLLISIAVFLLYNTGQTLWRDRDTLDWEAIVASFILPLALTVVVIPFLYLFFLLMEYELMFTMMRFFNERVPITVQKRCAIILALRGHLSAIHQLRGTSARTIASKASFGDTYAACRKYLKTTFSTTTPTQ